MNKFNIGDEVFTLTLDKQQILDCIIKNVPVYQEKFYDVFCPTSCILSSMRKEKELFEFFNEANKKRKNKFKKGDTIYFIKDNKIYFGIFNKNNNNLCNIKNNFGKFDIDFKKVFYTEYEAKLYKKYNN